MATNNNKKTNTSSTKKKSSTSSKKSSNYNYQKKAYNELKKTAKRYPKGFLIALLIVAVVIGIGLAVYFLFIKNKNNGSTSSSEVSSSEHSHEVVGDGISINFLELGDWHTGDCTFIKAGDADILIDAGSVNQSAPTIINFVNNYCTDGKLEYVVATHAHEDHIAGFYSTSSTTGIFDTYKIGTLIDFSRTNKENPGDTSVLGRYIKARDTKIASGDIEHHYTALQCVEGTDGAQKEFVINESTKMTVLKQKFYYPEDPEDSSTKTSGENNFSVCTLFTQGSNNYLFTGDLEKAGETSLVELNELPHCQLFKGGHHGSKTSSNEVLLNVIQPETVCICSCCGSPEFKAADLNTFPTQETINRIAKYTSQIYVTSLYVEDDEKKFTSLNGNITFKCDDGINYTVAGSNNSIILKETDWFKENRTWPSNGV